MEGENVIERFLEAAGVQLKELAAESGVAASTLSNVRRGNRPRLNADSAARVLAAMNARLPGFASIEDLVLSAEQRRCLSPAPGSKRKIA